MDGPTSRLPSSVTSITNPSGNNHPITNPSTPSTPRAFYATQSLRDLHNSASFNSSFNVSRTPSDGVDPPRPAKEGYEWVWFPGGYWAERERVDLPRYSSHSTRHFKWRKKSGRNSSSRETGESDSTFQGSPKVLEPTVESASQAPLASPWLSEEAHVASLQQPAPPQQPETKHQLASLQQPEIGSREQNNPSPKSFPWAKAAAALTHGNHASAHSLSSFSPVSETGSSKQTFNGSGSESEGIPVRPTSPSVRARSPLRSPLKIFKSPQIKPKRSWRNLLPIPGQVRYMRHILAAFFILRHFLLTSCCRRQRGKRSQETMMRILKTPWRVLNNV